MKKKVIGVILTYNRKELLERCLEAIHSQSRPCDMVLVINNASSDDTLDFLRSGKYPNIKVYSLRKNVGAAGGFNAGFRLAYDNGADYVWMMDDDVIPDSDALAKLLEADEFLEKNDIKRSYVVSTAYTEGGQVTNTPQVSTRKNKAGYFDWPELLQHGMVAVSSGTFVSILVPSETLNQYGLPIASMFIWGEDAEYTLRITREYPGYMVGTSRVVHIRHGGGTISIVNESNPRRVTYYKNFVRNNVYISKIYKTRRRTASVLFNNFTLAGKLLLKKHPGKAWIVIQGVMESVCFRPKIEYLDGHYDYSNLVCSYPDVSHDETSQVEKPYQDDLLLGYMRST